MNIRTVKIILIGLGAAAIIFAVAGIFPLMSDIQKESQSFLFQKKERINLAVRTGNLSDVEDIPFDRPFVGPIDPFDFVDFLEEEAELSGLSIVIERRPVDGAQAVAVEGDPVAVEILARLDVVD